MKAPRATFSCGVDGVAFVPEILRRGGFQVAPRQGPAPAIFDCTVSDGVRRAAVFAVKHPRKADATVVLAPLGTGGKWRALFGRKRFLAAVIACLLLGAPGGPPGPDPGRQGAGVPAPLIPPPPRLVARAAREMPRPDEG